MQKENVAIPARHAGTFAADRRARIRPEKLNFLREGLKESFAVPLLPERHRKRSHDAPDGPSEKLLTESLKNERVNFASSQGKAQLGIAESKSSEKVFGYILCKVSETAKCLVNRRAKLSATDVRWARKKWKVLAQRTMALMLMVMLARMKWGVPAQMLRSL